jgi:hypothetical protein
MASLGEIAESHLQMLLPPNPLPKISSCSRICLYSFETHTICPIRTRIARISLHNSPHLLSMVSHILHIFPAIPPCHSRRQDPNLWSSRMLSLSMTSSVPRWSRNRSDRLVTSSAAIFILYDPFPTASSPSCYCFLLCPDPFCFRVLYLVTNSVEYTAGMFRERNYLSLLLLFILHFYYIYFPCIPLVNGLGIKYVRVSSTTAWSAALE